MVEVMVSSVIFAGAAAAVFAVIATSKTPQLETDRKAAAAMYARSLFDNLRLNLSADSWNTNQFSTGTHNLTASGIYNARYVVENIGATGAKKVTLNVSW